MLPILYTAELDLPEADVERFLDWFAFRHVPDLTRSGFPVSTCYRALEGDMNLIDIYELPSADVLASPVYAGMGGRDAYAAEILAKRRDKSNTVYTQRAVAPEGFGAGASLDADWVSILRFDAGPEVAAGVEAALRAQAAKFHELGATRIRFAERGPDHPVYPTHRPRWLAMAEWPSRPGPDASLSAVLDHVPPEGLSGLKPFLGHRVYPWPDERGLPA